MASSTTMIVWVQIEGKSKKKVTISSNTDYDDLAGIATNGMSDPYIRDNVQVECEDVLMNPSDSVTSRVLERWGTPDKPFILRLRTKSLQEDEPLEEEQGRTLQRLPPLEPFSLSSTQAHSDHDPATIELKHLEMPGEAIVLKLQKYQIYDTWNVDYLHYYNETDIRNYVAEVLRMIIYALKLKDVEVRCEISVFELRPDLWLVQRRHNHNHFTPIGVVEVKRPAVDLMPSPLGNGKVLGQLYDYLVMLKTQFDLNFAIGIVTTYKEWRICWLQEDDSIITTLSHENDAVQAVSSEIVPEISMQDEKDDDDDQSAEKSTSPRCLCGTDIMTIHPDSTEVIVSVASAINKMLQVKTLSSRLIRKNREYFVYSKSGWFWAKSPWNDDHNPVYNIMPHGNSSQFFILKSLGNGIEGRVWLACTKSRRVCALKFRKDNDLEQTEKEAEWWKRLGFQASRVVTLVKNKYAIVMPYLLPCSNLQVQVENFYKLAEDAVCHMSSKKLCHHDIHIANMGYYHSSNGEVKISFLDLSSVSEMTSDKAKKKMLKKIEKFRESAAISTQHHPTYKLTEALSKLSLQGSL